MLDQSLEWPHAALLAAKLQFGLGVLAIPSTFRALGIVPGVVCLTILSTISAFSSVDMKRIHDLHPDVDSLPSLHYHLFGRAGSRAFAVLCFVFTTSVVAAGLVTSSIALNEITSHASCTFLMITVATLCVLLVGTPLRSFQRVSWLGWFGFSCIAVAVYVLAIVLLIKRNVWWHVKDIRAPAWFRSQAGFDERMNAIAVQLICVAGNMAFYGLLIEMRDRRTFTRAIFVGQSIVLLNSLIVGLTIAFAAGQHLASPALSTAGKKTQKICYAIALPGLMISALLFANLTAMQLYVKICRRTRTQRTWLVWTACMLIVVVLAYLAAQAVPMFDQILSLIGALTGPCFVLIVPGYTRLYLIARSKKAEKDRSWPRQVLSSLRTDVLNVRVEIIACLLVLLVGLLLTCACTFSGVRTTLQTLKTLPQARKPFVCELKSSQ